MPEKDNSAALVAVFGTALEKKLRESVPPNNFIFLGIHDITKHAYFKGSDGIYVVEPAGVLEDYESERRAGREPHSIRKAEQFDMNIVSMHGIIPPELPEYDASVGRQVASPFEAVRMAAILFTKSKLARLDKRASMRGRATPDDVGERALLEKQLAHFTNAKEPK